MKPVSGKCHYRLTVALAIGHQLTRDLERRNLKLEAPVGPGTLPPRFRSEPLAERGGPCRFSGPPSPSESKSESACTVLRDYTGSIRFGLRTSSRTIRCCGPPCPSEPNSESQRIRGDRPCLHTAGSRTESRGTYVRKYVRSP
jgi:hypothetical protein